jgi:hypothetical protein
MDAAPRPPQESGSPKKVFFHIGAPKTGSTYLQNVLFQNKGPLSAAGVLFPYDEPPQCFFSMLDFRGVGWGGKRPKEFRGHWDAVATRAREWPGNTVLLSNELFAAARPDRIEAGLATLQPADVHVIFTARDLARQLVSDWQEQVKHKHTVTLETFVSDLIELGRDAPAPFGELFWGAHDAAYVLERWARFIPASNIHVVTVGHPGAPPDTLWRRYCAVTGLMADDYDTETPRVNQSMGVAETELLRRMNASVQHMGIDVYDPLVRLFLAGKILAGGSSKITLPPEHIEWVTKRSQQLVDELASAGYRVEGDLEDLIPRPSDHLPHVSPTGQSEADLAPTAIKAATGLLVHSGRQRRRLLELQPSLGAVPSPRAPSAADTVRDRLSRPYWSLRSAAGRVLRRTGLRGASAGPSE